MTIKEINMRMEALKKDRLHHEKMSILIDGALQDCEYWLNLLSDSNEVSENGEVNDKEKK